MTAKEQRDYEQMYCALRRIAKYDTPAQMMRSSRKQWGLDFAECVEYAYENIQGEAKSGLKGVRKPKPKCDKEKYVHT
jgi:hypothetical protein